MLQVIPVSVEKDVPRPASDDHAQDYAEHYHEKRIFVDTHAPALGEVSQDEKCAYEAGHVGKTVPANLEGTDLHGNRVEHLIQVVEHLFPYILQTKQAAHQTRPARNNQPSYEFARWAAQDASEERFVCDAPVP